MKPGSGKSVHLAISLEEEAIQQKLVTKFGSREAGTIAALKHFGHRFQLVRDFAVIDANSFKHGLLKPATGCIILHLPSSHWNGFTIPYKDALASLQASPESDQQLLAAINSELPTGQGMATFPFPS